MSGMWVECPASTEGSDVTAFHGVLTNGCGTESLGLAISELIASACRDDKMYLMSPMLDDEATAEALLEASARGVRIKLITALAEYRDRRIRFVTKGFSEGERPDRHFAAVTRLTRAHVLVRALDCLSHVKLAMITKRSVVISSANLAANALGRGRTPSVEAGISFSDQEFVNFWERSFKAIWHAASFGQRLMGRMLSIQRLPRTQRIPFCAADMPRRMADCEVLWNWPGVCDDLQCRFIEMVQAARKSVLLVALSFYDVDRIAGMMECLMDALSRGVRITVLVRPEQFKPDDYPDPATLCLIKAGLELKGLTGLHAKGIVVDGVSCGITSANINPYSLATHGDASNLEMGYFGNTARSPMDDYGLFLRSIEAQATHEYRPNRMGNVTE